jgi:putative chitinase
MTEFILTKRELGKIIRNDEIDYWYDAMAKVLPANDINTKKRVAGFIAQCAVESGDFNTLEENLNYSVAALKRVFKRYFKDRDPEDYARNPEKLANYVYMDEFRTKRGALGNIHPGDGWKFRGRGLKQITGRSNYERFAKDHGLADAEAAVEFIETKEGALSSAVWFWNKANCNRFADRGDIEGLSRAINGGTNGLSLRIKKWEKALEVIDENNTWPVPQEKPKEEDLEGLAPTVRALRELQNRKNKERGPAPDAKKPTRILRIGSKGDDVYAMQIALGMTPSEAGKGVFGPKTHRAVKSFQRSNGLMVDGIAGPNTLDKLFS